MTATKDDKLHVPPVPGAETIGDEKGEGGQADIKTDAVENHPPDPRRPEGG